MGKLTQSNSHQADLTSIGPLVTAFVTAAGAWALFEPKLERIRAIRSETGRYATGFFLCYVLPQWALIVVCGATVLFLLAATLDAFQPHLLPPFLPLSAARKVLQLQNIIAVVIIVAALGIAIKWNLVPRILIAFTQALSLLPIPGLRSRFGHNGESVGWHQAVVVCEGPDKGAPLLLDHQAIDRVASNILARLAQGAGNDNYAEEPAGLPQSTKANIALFGCILEANTYAFQWPQPKWNEFYASLADIQRDTSLFSPSELSGFGSGQAFFAALRAQLDRALTARGQPAPPDSSLAAAPDIVRTWELLNAKAAGDVLRLCPGYLRAFGGAAFWLDRRLCKFPRLNDEGMRPQLIKLLTRWNTVPMQGGTFVQPFSKRMAWLLLQEGVLRALPEVKEVTFHGTGQVGVSRIAMRRVLQTTSMLIEAGASAEARAAALQIGRSEWNRFQAVDFVLWSWAATACKAAGSQDWDKAKWRWKFEDGRALRTS